MDAVPAVVGVGDVGELYGSLSRRLEQIVRHDATASDEVIEDACQVAWGRLVAHASRVRPDAALSWLATTAVREVRKTTRRGARELPLDARPDANVTDSRSPATSRDAEAPSPMPGPPELAELREQLRELAHLPQRQRQMVWLHGAGLSYVEIAAATGCTRRTVERQLLRAKRALREG
jgi:RNA polymerase sigma factor (sigma-70 family)